MGGVKIWNKMISAIMCTVGRFGCILSGFYNGHIDSPVTLSVSRFLQIYWKSAINIKNQLRLDISRVCLFSSGAIIQASPSLLFSSKWHRISIWIIRSILVIYAPSEVGENFINISTSEMALLIAVVELLHSSSRKIGPLSFYLPLQNIIM